MGLKFLQHMRKRYENVCHRLLRELQKKTGDVQNYPPAWRGLTRAPLGTESAPSWFFQNKSKTIADINAKFGVPYPTSI